VGGRWRRRWAKEEEGRQQRLRMRARSCMVRPGKATRWRLAALKAARWSARVVAMPEGVPTGAPGEDESVAGVAGIGWEEVEEAREGDGGTSGGKGRLEE